MTRRSALGALAALVLAATVACASATDREQSSTTTAPRGSASPSVDPPAVRPSTPTSTPHVSSRGDGRRWPLQVSRDGGHLESPDGTPFFVVADTAWGLMTGLAVREARTYIDLRQEQGFNTILTNVVFVEPDTPGPRGTAFVDGDVRRPSEEWFAGIDRIVAHAEERGVLIGLGTLWLRTYDGPRWVLPPTEALHEYGRMLGSRYASSDNVFFFVGGDDDPALWGEEVAALAEGIEAGHPDPLITFHSWGKAPQMAGAPWVDFHSFQWNSNSPPYSYQDVREVSGYRPTRPVLDIEPAYDPLACCGEDVDTSEHEIRRNGWWAALSGALGVVYGGPRSTWNVGVETGGELPRHDIDRPAAHQTAAIGRILRQHPWWLLEPDWRAVSVTGDRGTFGASDYVTAARASDGSLVAAYAPSPVDLQVDLSRLSGSGTAQWFDPRTGRPVGEPAHFEPTGRRTFTTPLPADGLLVLTSRPRDG